MAYGFSVFWLPLGRAVAVAQGLDKPIPCPGDATTFWGKAWCDNLVDNWDECVAEAGLATAKVWGLYMAGSRLGFERNGIQLHQVLATRTGDNGRSGYPLRPDFGV